MVTNGLAAVLFDMDGLLVDTEPLWFETETEVMARLGGPWTKQDQAALLGGSMERSVELPARAGDQARAARGGRAVADGGDAQTGRGGPGDGAAGRARAAGRGGRRRAARTPSSPARCDRSSRPCWLATGFRFPVTVCGEDVPATKPDPAPYQLAAKLLDVEPGRCVALEDSPNGVASATAAGCLVVAVPSFARRPARPRPPRRPLAADVTLGTLRALASANA